MLEGNVAPDLLEEYRALISEANKTGYEAYWIDENDLLPKALTDANLSHWYTELGVFRKLNAEQRKLANSFVRDLSEKHSAIVSLQNGSKMEIKKLPFGDGYFFRTAKNGKWEAMGVIESEWEFISWINQSGAVPAKGWS